MNTKLVIGLALKVIALTIVMFVSFIIAGIVIVLQSTPAEEAGASQLPLLLVCLLNTLVLVYAITRSRWCGLRLIAAIFATFYGIMFVMSLIEAIFFMTNIPESEMPKLFMMGAIVALIFSPLAVLILGKMRRDTSAAGQNSRLVMPWYEWIWKLVVIVAAYLILYFTFGYFVAWQNPVVREFYGGGPLIGFFPHMRAVFQHSPLLVPFQVLRAIMWVAIALPVIRMMKGKPWEASLAVSLNFAVLMNAQHLLPNPYMPQAVRIVHLIETTPSNFIFGWVLVWLINRHHSSLGELFQWSKETR
jgi:hypothetical protein